MSEFNDNNNQNEVSNVSVTETAAEEIQAGGAVEPIMAGTEVISGVEKAKKGPAVIIAVIAVIIVVLLGGSVAAYNLSPWVKNNVKMLINDPEDYYAWVENENIEKTAEVIAEAYDKITSSDSESIDMELRVDLEKEEISSWIKSNSGVSLEDAGITIPGSISLTESGTVIDGYSAMNATLNADDKTFLTINGYVKDGKYYYQFPELSSSYIEMDLISLLEDAYSEVDLLSSGATGSSNIFAAMSDGSGLQDILTDDELEELLVNYFDIVFENIDDVELEKGVECEVNGIETEYNQLIAEIDEGCLYGIVKDILKEAKNDKTIIKIVESAGIMTQDDYQSAVEELLDELGEYSISGGDTLATMNVYVDSKGVIKGRSIEIADEEDLLLDYMIAVDGSDKSFEANIVSDGEGITISGEFTEKSDKTNGTLNITVLGTTDGDQSFDIEFKDIKTENDDKGYLSGEINVDLSSLGVGNFAVVLSSDGNSQEISSDITIDGTKYASVYVNYSNNEPEEIPAFDDSQTVYTYTEDGAELQQYIESADIEGFLKGIGDVIGIDLSSFIDGYNYVTELPEEYVDPTVIDDGYDDDYNYDYPESVEYDFSKIKIQIDGKDVTIPGKIDGILDKLTVDVDSIEAGMYEYLYSEDGSLAVCLENLTDADLAPGDCTITGLYVTDESDLKLTIDGIGLGSNISEAVSKYGCKLDDPDSGYIYIEDSNFNEFYGDITFFYYDGLIYEIDIDFY